MSTCESRTSLIRLTPRTQARDRRTKVRCCRRRNRVQNREESDWGCRVTPGEISPRLMIAPPPMKPMADRIPSGRRMISITTKEFAGLPVELISRFVWNHSQKWLAPRKLVRLGTAEPCWPRMLPGIFALVLWISTGNAPKNGIGCWGVGLP